VVYYYLRECRHGPQCPVYLDSMHAFPKGVGPFTGRNMLASKRSYKL
jgi:hypothetical protein